MREDGEPRNVKSSVLCSFRRLLEDTLPGFFIYRSRPLRLFAPIRGLELYCGTGRGWTRLRYRVSTMYVIEAREGQSRITIQIGAVPYQPQLEVRTYVLFGAGLIGSLYSVNARRSLITRSNGSIDSHSHHLGYQLAPHTTKSDIENIIACYVLRGRVPIVGKRVPLLLFRGL